MTDIKSRIESLKKEKNAVILAHYYVPGEVQEIADYIGDSFYLSKIAKDAEQDTILWCIFYGRKCQDTKPWKAGAYARYYCWMPDGIYGTG